MYASHIPSLCFFIISILVAVKGSPMIVGPRSSQQEVSIIQSFNCTNMKYMSPFIVLVNGLQGIESTTFSYFLLYLCMSLSLSL